MKFRMRSLAFLLSLALCVESAPAAVLAAQPEAGVSWHVKNYSLAHENVFL